MPTPHTSLGSPVSSEPVHMSPLEPRGGHGDGLALGRSWSGVGRGGRVPRRGRPHTPSSAVLILAFCVAGVAALSVASLCWCR